MAVSRKSVRKKLAELLQPVLATLASDVLPYQPSKIGATPGVYIRSTSAVRPPLTVRGKFTKFAFDILILVLQADATASPPWTEDLAEDLLDDIEAAVCTTLTENRVVDGVWDSVEYSNPSTIESMREQDVPYRLEAIRILVEVHRDA